MRPSAAIARLGEYTPAVGRGYVGQLRDDVPGQVLELVEGLCFGEPEGGTSSGASAAYNIRRTE